MFQTAIENYLLNLKEKDIFRFKFDIKKCYDDNFLYITDGSFIFRTYKNCYIKKIIEEIPTQCTIDLQKFFDMNNVKKINLICNIIDNESNLVLYSDGINSLFITKEYFDIFSEYKPYIGKINGINAMFFGTDTELFGAVMPVGIDKLYLNKIINSLKKYSYIHRIKENKRK